MTTDAVAVLPNRPPAGAAYTGDGTRSARSDADAARTSERSPVERADAHKTDAAEQDSASRQNNRADHGRSRFEETLKKRIERDAPDKEDAEKGKASAETEAAQAAVIFQAPHKTPITLKPAVTHESKQPTPLQKDSKVAVLKANLPQTEKSDAEPGEKAAQAAGVQAHPAKAVAKTTPTAEATKEAGVAKETSATKETGATKETVETQKAAPNTQSKGGEASLKDGRNNLDGLEKQTDPTGDKKISTSQPPKADAGQGRPMADNNTENKPVQAEKPAPAVVRTEAGVSDTKPAQTPSVQTTEEVNPRESSLKTQNGQTLQVAKPAETLNQKEAESSVSPTPKTPDPTQLLSAAVPQSPATPPPASTTAASNISQVDAAKGFVDASAPRPIEQIIQQLQLRNVGGDSQLRMTLSPEELGSIRITFRQVNNEIVGVLEAQRTETRQELERSVSQLTASMETAGLQVRRIDVVPWSANNQAARNDSSAGGFDAATEREMYRPSSDGSEASQRKSSKGFMSNLSPSSADRRTALDSLEEERAGLNFYL